VSISTITAVLITIDLKVVGLILASVFLGFIVDVRIAKSRRTRILKRQGITGKLIIISVFSICMIISKR